MKGPVNSVSLVNLNQAGHKPVVRSWKLHLGLTADCRQNEALVSGHMKCHPFVVTALPR